MGHRVEEAVELDMIIESDPRQAPFRELVIGVLQQR